MLNRKKCAQKGKYKKNVSTIWFSAGTGGRCVERMKKKNLELGNGVAKWFGDDGCNIKSSSVEFVKLKFELSFYKKL